MRRKIPLEDAPPKKTDRIPSDIGLAILVALGLAVIGYIVLRIASG